MSTRRARSTKGGRAPDASPDLFKLTDLGNAERLIAARGGRLRFCHEWGTWLAWDGGRWQRDAATVYQSAKATVRAMYGAAERLDDPERRKALAEHARRSESGARIDAMVRLARTEPGVPLNPDALDSHPWLLNIENGTLDLEAGKLREHDARDHLTKLAPVRFDPRARAPRWEAFVTRIAGDDQELVAFLRRFVGYSLTGVIRDHVLVSFYGTGANGKSTFLNTIAAILGDYAYQAPADLLLARTTEAHPTALASLFGVRFAVCNEVPAGRRIDEARMKWLTGGDPITARRMHENLWTFPPTHKLVLATNHKPDVRTTDLGTWRRQKLVPFTVTIPKAEQDPRLPELLRAESAGILNWALQGCREWQRDDLGEPGAVRDATEAWRAESDPLGGFLAERCAIESGAQARAADLYDAYRSWCAETGDDLVTVRVFGMRLGERGLESRKSHGTKVWRGVRLLSRAAAAAGDQGDERGRSSQVAPLFPSPRGSTPTHRPPSSPSSPRTEARHVGSR
jgi:putative DNA primase/helicase